MTTPNTESAQSPETQPTPVLWRVALGLFVPLFALFFATARNDLPYHIDAATNVFTAWTLGTTGSPVLDEYRELADPDHRGVFAWVVPSQRGPVSQYPPGAALLAAPLYAIWSDAQDVELVADNATDDTVRATVPVPALWPAALVASATTAAALSMLALLVLQIGGSVRSAVAAATIAAVGTSAWSVAADQLWQHGPNMLWISLGVYAASRARWATSGIAFSGLVLTRPPVVIVGAVLGLSLLWNGEVRAALRLLAGVTPGVLALFLYNRWLFSEPSVAGGYGSTYIERAVSPDIPGYLSNIVSALIDPRFGLLIWSPFIALAVLGGAMGVHRLPRWVPLSAIGGLAYLLLQLKLNRASGGSGFSYYRYPLEALTAAGPLLAVGWSTIWNTGRLGRASLVATGTFAGVAHLVAVV